MTSDESLEELHAFARLLDIPPRRFEDKSTPHFDLNDEQRRLAVERGAAEVSRAELVRRGLKNWENVRPPLAASGR
jgi:hypothetical protein